MINNPYQKYQQASVQTASGPQLLLMLYDGAIRFVRLGIEGINKRNIELANNSLIKAQAIVHELIAGLNYDYPIAKDLLSLYEYFVHRLIQANIKKDVSIAEEVLNHLLELREAWGEAVKQPVSGL
ncbi:flagellar export chaperone FliS [Cohnella thailandensis]|uniref:Flagellar export chaperone FliS n=1 Tax=Cohnella thailandensis TaxID=557557 RepID=A0A841SR86_9BACL|nr:flagellar export chaperone FliS [Cohnella thailandensis]MBB6632585.1 flagellar export chaperone FliS [Cohnella thailandensis]MBP1971879.1 flagellar protein FliS [Cohnella thailandensis]